MNMSNNNFCKLSIKKIYYMYNIHMAKRSTGVEKGKTSRSKKTKKRLEIKKEMLAKKAAKKKK